MKDTSPTASSGALLLAGCLLAAAGLAVEPAQTDPPPQVQATFAGGYGTADSNGRMIAVTGMDITGSSVLYVIDTVDPHVSVYQANGGTQSTQGIEWVGARRIDLDLAVDGWKDKSEKKYKELRAEFQDLNLLPAER